ncbi:hypothetical protein ACLMJK_004055 [Lecanora helva]
MADALCGPSTALQTFQKQASADRTLQQDRLAARHAQAEKFRSHPGPNAGSLDAEFEAFQAGLPLEAGYSEPQRFSNAAPAKPFYLGVSEQSSLSSNWAADFQSLNLHGAQSSSIPPAQFRHHAPPQRNQTPAWHEDFLRQQSSPPPSQSQFQKNQNSGWAGSYGGSLVPQYDSTISPTVQQKQPDPQRGDMYDEAAFERAFANAQSEMHTQQEEEIQLDQHLYRTQEAGQSLGNPEVDGLLDNVRIGSDRINDRHIKGEAEKNDEADADEIARTAGQLLENVKGDQSQKFQESNFLSLMRQLRDKEVRVEGDKLVDVSMPSSTA